MESTDTIESLHRVQGFSDGVLSTHIDVLPTSSALETATSSLFQHLPNDGIGLARLTEHLLKNVTPGLNGSSLSPSYYGFVTGGVTPAARIADNIVTLYDQNVAVHLTGDSIATTLEDRALQMLLELLNFDPAEWKGRLFTTGATASNVLGLACGREHILQSALSRALGGKEVKDAVGELGLLEACRRAGVEHLQVLTTMGHSSLWKAASVVGIGRACVYDVARKEDDITFDMEKLEIMLQHDRTLSIVVISCGEVNTGAYATHSKQEVLKLRDLCDKYGAWLHVDGAFGIFARALSDLEFDRVSDGTRYLELADSITADAHKLLNVPYDCGVFFCRHSGIAQHVFQNPNAAYLSSGTVPSVIQSPLNVGLENSRRFRGLPVYATLAAYGRAGYVDMLQRQTRFARAVAEYIHYHGHFDLLPEKPQQTSDMIQEIFIIVLFRAKDETLNSKLVKKINATSKMYVSGTLWKGKPASRIAVSNWQVDVKRDLDIVKKVLENVVSDWQKEISDVC